MPKCEMRENCLRPVTHIGSKGYVYCAQCGTTRGISGYELTRPMKAWELQAIAEGKTLPRYRIKEQ